MATNFASTDAEQELMDLLQVRAGKGQTRLQSRAKRAVATMRKAAERYRGHVKPKRPGKSNVGLGFEPEVVKDGISSARSQLRDLREALDGAGAAVRALGPQAISLLRGRLPVEGDDPGPMGKIVQSLNTPELKILSQSLDRAIQQADSAPNKEGDVALVHLASVVGRELQELGIPLALTETGDLVTGKKGGASWARAIELCLTMAGIGEGRKVRKRTLKQARDWLSTGAFS